MHANPSSVPSRRDAAGLVTALSLLAAGLAACHDAAPTDAGCTAGAAGCPCGDDDRCDAGLVCASDRCEASAPPDATGADAGPTDAVLIDTAPSTDVEGPDAPPPSCDTTPAGDFCACVGNADCASGYCVPSREGAGGVCTTTCSDTCPEGWQCLFAPIAGGDPTYLCLQPDLHLCRPCASDAECREDTAGASGARCVTYDLGRGSFCGAACEADADCPGGYACREVPALATGAPVRQCVLADETASCACSGRAVAEAAWTACAIDGCEGTRVCGEEGLGACLDRDGEACVPTARVAVTFDAQGGASVDPATRLYAIGQPYGELPGTTREGHAFGGWWTAPGASGEEATAEATVTQTEAYTLFAGWRAERYALRFDSEGGTDCQATEVTFGAPYGPLCETTRAGYTFAGWWTEDGGRGREITPDTTVTTANEQVLHARWDANAYTVDFDTRGGAPCAPLRVTFGSAYGTLCAPTRTGYAFGGWWLDSAEIGSGTTVATAADHTLTARWSGNLYTVTFDSEGGSPCAVLGVTFGAPYGTLCATTRPGFAFTGWYLGDDGAGTLVTSETVVSTAAPHTLHAGWSSSVLTVTFDSEGGSSCPARVVGFGGTYGADGPLCLPTREGYTFGGWYLGDDGTGAVVTATTAVANPQGHTLHARWTANSYTVRFDAEGGSACQPLGVTFGATYGAQAAGGLFCVPTRTGYTFGGWWSGDNGTGSEVSPETIVATANDHALYARWTARPYTVTFDNEGGSGCATVAVTFGALYGASGPLCVPIRPGYTFAAWHLGDNGTGDLVEASTVVTVAADHRLHARWTPNSYLVSFQSGGGSACATLSVTFGRPYGENVGGTLCAPTRTGYAFAGWWTAEAGGAEVTGGTLVTTTANHTLFARWSARTFTVTFEAQGGSTPDPASKTVSFGGVYGALAVTTRAGHAFGGWWTGPDATGRAISPTSEVATAENHALYAHWVANGFTVTYDNEGGSGCGATAVVFGQAYGLTAPLCAPTRTGHTFGGWFLGDNGTGTRVQNDTVVTVGAPHTLYARWTANSYTVTFESRGGSACPAITVTFGQPYVQGGGALCTPSREGHTFGGWWDGDATGAARITGSSIVAMPNHHALYARWAPNAYTVTYDNGGGTGCTFFPAVLGDVYGAAGALCTPTRTGYSFSGWWTAAGGVGSPVTATTTVTIASDHAIFARWTANSYSVTFDSRGGSVCGPLPVTFGAPYGGGGALCTPTRPGYSFGGWWTAQGGTGDNVTGATLVATASDHVLYARWNANAYTVTYGNAGGAGCSLITVTFGATYGAAGPLCTPTRLGYSFLGWWTEPAGAGTEVRADTTVSTANDHTLHARWTANSYTVSFDSEGGSSCGPLPVTFAAPYVAGGGSLCTPSRAGYAFGGWWTGDNGTGEAVTGATIVATANNHVLYARWTANAYTITFDAGQGTPATPASKVVTFGQTYGALATTSRIGYAFAGWWTTAAGAGAEVVTTTELTRAEPHTLHARWTPRTYAVSFDSEGGSGCAAISATFDAAYAPSGLCAPSRAGYSFGGWWTGDNGTGNAVTGATLMTTPNDHTLHARWSANSYTVTYDNAGGAGCGTLQVTFGATYGASGPLCTPNRAGHTFGGWWTEPAGGGTSVTAGTTVTTPGDHALRAKWTANRYTLSFDSEGGSSCGDLLVTFGDAYGNLCTPSRAGYTFDGWKTGDGGTGASVTSATIVSTASNHTVHARWVARTYTVSFDSEGGSACGPLPVTFAAAYVPGGGLCTPDRAGYTFGGWWTGDGGTGASVTGATVVTTPSDHVLYARWTANVYTVTFDAAGGTAPDPAQREVTFGLPYGPLPASDLLGYTFLGWRTGPNGTGAAVTEATDVAIPGNHTLHASWQANVYTVYYDSNYLGEITFCDPFFVTYGDVYGFLCYPFRSGYEFLGWWSEPFGGTEVTESTLVTVPGDHTIYARWFRVGPWEPER